MDRSHRSHRDRRQPSLFEEISGPTKLERTFQPSRRESHALPDPDGQTPHPPSATRREAEAVAEAVSHSEWGDTPSGDRASSTPSATATQDLTKRQAGLTGTALARFDERREFACFVCDGAGLRCALDERQVWRFGRHKLSVTLWLDERFYYVLLIHSGWPNVPAPKSLALAEVFAASCTGELRELGRPEMARFKRRALVAAGLTPAPERVRLPALPEDAPESARRTWGAIADFLTERRMTEPPGTPVALSSPWFSNWSRVPEPTIRAGKRWLEKRGFIQRVGEAPSGRGRPTYLWSVKGECGNAGPLP